jgi:anti-sigma28 factor (negative regulator of flagellin synthesis)
MRTQSSTRGTATKRAFDSGSKVRHLVDSSGPQSVALRLNRVHVLRQAVQEGSYNPSSEDIAGSLLMDAMLLRGTK